MASRIQTQRSEGQISVDLSESNPDKAVDRRRSVAASVRDDDGEPRRTKTEDALFKRMNRFEKNIRKEFDQKQADSEARHQREISALREENERLSLERGENKEAADAHEAAMALLTKELEAANEKGDSALAAQITAKMIKADGEYHAKLTGTKQRADGAKKAAPTQDPNLQQQVQRRTGPTAAGARFIKANEDWWDDPEFEIEKQAASQLYVNLTTQDGFEANSDETFKEVAKRLKVKFPTLEIQMHGVRKVRGPDDDADPDDDDEGLDDQADAQLQRRAAAARVTDRGPASQGTRSRETRRTLTPAEIKTMRDVGLNPENDRDVVAFTREIQAADAARA
jgi:hypothetical protein